MASFASWVILLWPGTGLQKDDRFLHLEGGGARPHDF